MFAFLGGNVSEYAKHLFRVIDTDKDKMVNFEEVMIGFHNLSGNGNEREKLKIVFQVRNFNLYNSRNLVQNSLLYR